MINTTYSIITCSILWWHCCVHALTACHIFFHTKPMSAHWHKGRKKKKTTSRLSVNSHHKSNLFCPMNGLNNMLQAFEGFSFSRPHTLSKAISSLSSLIVIKVMCHVNGWNVGLWHQSQKLAKSSLTSFLFLWKKKGIKSHLEVDWRHILICVRVFFVCLLCNEKWDFDRRERTECMELPGSVRLFR